MLPIPICLWKVWAGRLTLHRDHAKPLQLTLNAGWKSILHRCCTTYWKLIPVAKTTTGTMCPCGSQYSLAVPSTPIQPVYHPIRLCMSANWAESHCPQWRSWWLSLSTHGFKHVQQKVAFSSRKNTMLCSNDQVSILACSYSGSLSIHQLEGGAVPSIKPCYWNGSNDSTGLIVKLLSGFRHQKQKTLEHSHILKAFLYLSWAKWNIQHSDGIFSKITCQSISYNVLPLLFSLCEQQFQALNKKEIFFFFGGGVSRLDQLLCYWTIVCC